MADEFDRATALKRGGGAKVLSLDVESAERTLDVGGGESPDRKFERQWATEVLERALGRLKGEQQGKALEVFKLAHGADAVTNAEIASRLGMTPDAVAAALHRARKRLRELLLAEVGATVADAGEAEKELADLQRALGGGVS